MTRGRKGRGLHHSSIVHQREGEGATAVLEGLVNYRLPLSLILLYVPPLTWPRRRRGGLSCAPSLTSTIYKLQVEEDHSLVDLEGAGRHHFLHDGVEDLPDCLHHPAHGALLTHNTPAPTRRRSLGPEEPGN